MNIDSISGKNWISKEFSSDDINYFKTNYFLDEIVAKLLSIRKIKKEEILKSFNLFFLTVLLRCKTIMLLQIMLRKL